MQRAHLQKAVEASASFLPQPAHVIHFLRGAGVGRGGGTRNDGRNCAGPLKRLAPSTWSCTTPHGKAELTLANTGDLQGTYADGGAGGPRLQGRWGSMNDPVLGESCPVGACLFLNVGYALLLNAAVANGEGVGDHVIDAVLRVTTSVYGGASRGGGGGAPGAAWGQCARV